MVLVLMFALSVSTVAYDDGVVSMDIPSSFTDLGDRESDGMIYHQWILENDGSNIGITIDKNEEKFTFIDLSSEQIEEYVEFVKTQMIEGINAQAEGFHAEIKDISGEQTTINGYTGLRVSWSVDYTYDIGFSATANAESYSFSTDNNSINITLFYFSETGKELIQNSMTSLTIKEPLLLKKNASISSGNSIVGGVFTGALKGAAEGAIVGLVVSLIGVFIHKKKKRKAAELDNNENEEETP